MYAAAGGASLASRQARKKQAQQNTKNKATNQLILREKLAAKVASTPTKSKPFHQLPASYLRAPHQHHRKLSAGYTTVPGYDQHHKSLLPISEQSSSSHGGQPIHTPHQHHHHHHHPLHGGPCHAPHGPLQHPAGVGQLPLHKPTGFREYDKLATPPGKLNLQLHITTDDEGRPLTPAPGALERKCSVYRSRKLDPYDEHFFGNNNTTTISHQHQHQHQHQQDDAYYGQHQLPNGEQHGTYVCKWDTEYYCCDAEHRQLGVCTCDHIECAQGRAAWLERGRRCSVQETPASCHRRWVKRNRIQDSSLGGSSDDEDLLGVLRGPSSFANAFLYVGLGTIAIGLVIAFVGTGEKGFKTVELRLIGPSLIGLGLFCCILRILFCICPSHCLSSSRRARNKKNAKIDADHRTSLLRGDSKRVSIARGPHIPTKQPQIYPKSIVKTKTYEGVEALRQIATTSLFLQNEQKVSSNRIVPIIKEPEKIEEPPLELKRIDPLKADTLSVLDIVSISDVDDDSDDHSHKHHPRDGRISDTQVIDLTGDDEQSAAAGSHHQRKDSKLRRQRTSVNQQKPKDPGMTTGSSSSSSLSPGGGSGILMETSLMIIGPTPVSSPAKQQQQSLTVPKTTTLEAAPPKLVGGSSLLVTLPTQSTSSASAFGAIVAPSISNNNTSVPGSLSPLPSTSYLPSAAAFMSHICPLTPPPASGFTYNSSSSSSSNYLLSPSPLASTAAGAASSPGAYDPLTLGTNTITTSSSLLQSSAVTTTKTEPELVLSPAKLGQ
ncbi:uncharacterized protein LOC129777486 isoform X1 [Toxorhynchites rutilus septentrionalis]|uniref:uncharacterized protein LOC129777486 isoform X1 n=1 Tax=Toxorhynchites rutilus septentrionalis TaxID=329112 RepID=UPI00247A47CE|nr:uncharacterized protein LOC129777486 isoform X1 [Toxorhynchites rutilus septentrionalis]